MISEIKIGDYIVWSGWPSYIKPLKVVGFKDNQHFLITETTNGARHLYLLNASMGQWVVVKEQALSEDLID